MPKSRNIVVFSDGTGQDGGVRADQRLSNICKSATSAKMYRAARVGPDSDVDPREQVAFYDPGLCTDTSASGLTSLRRRLTIHPRKRCPAFDGVQGEITHAQAGRSGIAELPIPLASRRSSSRTRARSAFDSASTARTNSGYDAARWDVSKRVINKFNLR